MDILLAALLRQARTLSRKYFLLDDAHGSKALTYLMVTRTGLALVHYRNERI